MKHLFHIITGLAFLLSGIVPAMARDINVRGIVTNANGEPLQSVCIYDVENDKLIGSTNEEGKFLVVISDEGRLLFSILGMEDTEVPVEGRLTIDVELIASAITLDEVTVKAKIKLKDVKPEPTDIEIIGNYAHIKTRVKVPRNKFGTSSRLIIQPALYNVTARRMWYLKPVVYDGPRYHITQERMLDWDLSRDPLARFATTKAASKSGPVDIIEWRDSVYLDKPNQDFHCDMLMAIESYNRVYYRDTTTIANGTVNPLRFFQYEFLGSEVTDSTYFPTPEMQMRDVKGNIMLNFRVNDARLDMELGKNRSEMDALLSQLHRVENDPNAALKSFTISSTSSPEGDYDRNVSLSKRRMKSALDVILENLSPTSRKYLELHSDASVATWDDLVEMLRADSLVSEADAVSEIIGKYKGNQAAISNRIRQLPFYSNVLSEKYLPRMRKVSYQFLTSQFRYLTDEETYEVYQKAPESLSRYEFFRLYRYVARNDAEKETYIRKALEVHPKFLVAATDLAAMKLEQGQPDYSILEPFLVPNAKKIPEEARLNQIAACLYEQKYHEADSLASTLPEDPRFHKAKMYVEVFNGRYENALQEVTAESPVNEVVILLAMKANDQAWKRAQLLGGTAEEEYLKAIAANRVDEYLQAMAHLDRALELKPELREIAKIDGDLIDLMKEKEEMEAEDAQNN